MGAEPTLEVGTVLGGYRLEAVIGRGGMGAVYRGTHVKLGRRAAIKVLSESLAADPSYVSRFFHEARVVNEVRHPNIIDIIDFIDTQSPRRVAYVMELIEGPALSKLLAVRRLTMRQALNVALQVLDALSAVHRINVVHRDLKPDNLLVVGSLDTDLSDRPSVKVLDFGIAKVQEHSASHRTNTGMMLGTPAYMAPEQVAADTVSVKTDVYAVGEILFEMLAGERMFRGGNMQILRAKVGEKPPAFALPEDVAQRARLTALIASCVHAEQSMRPTLEAMSAELRELLASLSPQGDVLLPLVDRPLIQRTAALFAPTLVPSSNTAFRSPKPKVPLLAWAGITLVVLAAQIAGGVWYRQSEAPVELDVRTLEDTTQPVLAPVKEPEPGPPPVVESKAVEPH